MTSYRFDTKAEPTGCEIENMELLRARKRSSALDRRRIRETSKYSDLVQMLLQFRIVWTYLRFFKSALFVIAICDKIKRPPSAVFFFRKKTALPVLSVRVLNFFTVGIAISISGVSLP
jgi:hypothetical protein